MMASSTWRCECRVLESLTKDDLKKYFKFKKFEVMSFLSGVELLRMHDYNREVTGGSTNCANVNHQQI